MKQINHKPDCHSHRSEQQVKRLSSGGSITRLYCVNCGASSRPLTRAEQESESAATLLLQGEFERRLRNAIERRRIAGVMDGLQPFNPEALNQTIPDMMTMEPWPQGMGYVEMREAPTQGGWGQELTTWDLTDAGEVTAPPPDAGTGR
jgi:hypothetical protein